MEGVINNFCRGVTTKSNNQMVVIINNLNNRVEASKLIGKKVKYNTGKNIITGEIRSAHGNKGAVRVLFEKGMPGQAIGKKVIIE